MHRCYIQKSNWKDGYAYPSKEELHHITHVMRIKVGEVLEVFDGEGHEARAILVNEAGQNGLPCSLKLVSKIQREEQSTKITLFQAIPKGKRIDVLIEKSTELGVHSIVPMITERVVVKIKDAKSAEHKVNRWQAIALSAAKQCGRADIPSIKPFVKIDNLFEESPKPDIMLIASLEDSAQDFKAVLRDIRNKYSGIDSIGVFIGPEGDFTKDEHKTLVDTGAIPVSFGQLIMRVETAAIYAVSVLGYEFIN